ncbi:hypothetical protein SAMN05444354_1175 [Stigmatella aurantiaca]|uniref:DUF6444 domain-containing protein n=1 Tax=Stigmatella aurantiaca TaxID=41 RepID=A0A1H7YFM8_STIAU|nr:hypothetical protein SAMN05444354_1175 [Stigmatella aurantiaca]
MALVGALTQRVAELEEKLGQNSSNSSRPPSFDAPGTERPGKKRTGRRPGGQPGHKKHERALLPPEQVHHFKDLVPTHCQRCQRRLRGRASAPERHQVVEVPPLSAVVTEYRCLVKVSTLAALEAAYDNDARNKAYKNIAKPILRVVWIWSYTRETTGGFQYAEAFRPTDSVVVNGEVVIDSAP